MEMEKDNAVRCAGCAWLREMKIGPWCRAADRLVVAPSLARPRPEGCRFTLPEDAGAVAKEASVVERIRCRADKAAASRSDARAAMLLEIADEVEQALEEARRPAEVGGGLPWPLYADGTPLRFGDTPPWLDGEIVGIEVCVGENLDPRFTILGPGSEASFMGWEKIARA